MKTFITALILTLFTCIPLTYGKYACETITPTNMAGRELSFDVSVEGDEQLTFCITVSSSTERSVLDYTSATLSILSSDGFAGSCPVKDQTEENSKTYRVYIKRNSIDDFKFVVSTQRFVYGEDGKGNRTGSRIAVGTIYTIKLNEFIK